MRTLLLVAALAAAPVAAADFPHGSVVVSGFSTYPRCPGGNTLVTSELRVHDRGTGAALSDFGGATGLTTLRSTPVAAYLSDLSVFDASPAFTRFTSQPLQLRDHAVIRAMAPVSADAVWALVRNVGVPLYEVVLISRTRGVLLRRALPARAFRFNQGTLDEGATSMDVDATGCLLYYTTGQQIGRFDACTNRPLPDLTVFDDAVALRVLPDGGLLTTGGTVLRRYDRDGRNVAIIDLPQDMVRTAEALALDVDPRAAWVLMATPDCAVETAHLLRINLDSGELLDSFDLGYTLTYARSLAVIDGWWAAEPAALPGPRRRVGR